MKKGMVTVVVPNYNYAYFLPETIDSVIAQTYKNWELIVVDDNSTDNSREVVESYIKKYPQLDIRLFHNRKGPSGTPTPINIGIKNMKGEYFSWLSSDDAFLPAKLEEQVNVMKNNPHVGMIYTQTEMIDEKGLSSGSGSFRVVKSRRQFFLDLLQENFINGNTVLIRKHLLDIIGPLREKSAMFPDVWRAAEYEWWLKIALETTVVSLSQPLHLARLHPGNSPYNRSGFGQSLKKLFLSFYFTEYDLRVIAEKLELDEDEIVWVEAFTRRVLAEAGYPGVVTARHDSVLAGNPALEERIGKKVDEISRAAILLKCADFYWKISRFKEAISFIDRVLKLFPEIPDMKPHYMKASFLKSSGDHQKAREIFETVLEGEPVLDSPYRTGAAFHLGEIYHGQGQSEKAGHYFSLCLEENPKHHKAAQYLRQLGISVQKDHWEVGAERDPVRVIADLNNWKEFEISGVCDANMILRHVEKNRFENILDIGCGIGRILKPMSNAAKIITGIDTGQEMIRKAEIYLKDIPNKNLLWVDKKTVPFESHSFDLIYSQLVFMHLPRVRFESWLREASRLLRGTGIFWFQIYGDFGPAETLPQDCTQIGGTRAYSIQDLETLTAPYFDDVTIFKDKLDRYGGEHWYFCICRKPLG